MTEIYPTETIAFKVETIMTNTIFSEKDKDGEDVFRLIGTIDFISVDEDRMFTIEFSKDDLSRLLTAIDKVQPLMESLSDLDGVSDELSPSVDLNGLDFLSCNRFGSFQADSLGLRLYKDELVFYVNDVPSHFGATMCTDGLPYDLFRDMKPGLTIQLPESGGFYPLIEYSYSLEDDASLLFLYKMALTFEAEQAKKDPDTYQADRINRCRCNYGNSFI